MRQRLCSLKTDGVSTSADFRTRTIAAAGRSLLVLLSVLGRAPSFIYRNYGLPARSPRAGRWGPRQTRRPGPSQAPLIARLGPRLALHSSVSPKQTVSLHTNHPIILLTVRLMGKGRRRFFFFFDLVAMYST
uniref:Uncharacterized protein n=1 Tax=Molossus molossus TaxID=27622 RepID=A0A7J8DCH6_MOLMO|nr:hypothetical protein HJG59_009412 [Molossus molossus]